MVRSWERNGSALAELGVTRERFLHKQIPVLEQRLQQRSQRRLAKRVAAGLALTVGLWVGAVQIYRPDSLESTRELSVNELGEISPFLEWAYRAAVDHGVHLMGGLTLQWHGLTVPMQRKESRRIIEMLGTQGIEQVMLFDAARVLPVYGVRGELLMPVPDSGLSAAPLD